MSLLSLVDDEIRRRGMNPIVKPKESWEEFARKTMIRSGRNLKPFEPYDYQIEFVKQVEKHYGTVCVKTRQLGMSELCVSYLLWKCKDNPAYLGVVFSKTQDDSSNLARRTRIASAAHPEIELESSNLKDMKLKNGGRLVFRPATPHAARGLESVSAILFDEAAFVPDIEEIYGSALPATEMLGQDPVNGAKILIISTPNGRSSFFWNRVNESNPVDILQVCDRVSSGELPPVQHWTDRGEWCKFIVHWKAHPVYRDRPNYLEHQKTSKRLTDAQVQREYNLSFEASVARVFKDDLIAATNRGEWHSPEFRHSYLVGVDPSFGGEDFFTVRVWDVSGTPYRLVAQYRDRQKSIDYFISSTLDLLDPYHKQSGGSFLVSCETVSGGALVQQQLMGLRPEWLCECVTINNASKMLHTDRLVLQMERNQMLFPPDAGVDITNPESLSQAGNVEYAHFIQETTGASRTRQAESGWHDDTVMADAVAFAHLESVPVAANTAGGGSNGQRSSRATARVI